MEATNKLKSTPSIANALRTISRLKKINLEQLRRLTDIDMLQTLNKAQKEEIELLLFENEQLKERLRKYES